MEEEEEGGGRGRGGMVEPKPACGQEDRRGALRATVPPRRQSDVTRLLKATKFAPACPGAPTHPAVTLGSPGRPDSEGGT